MCVKNLILYNDYFSMGKEREEARGCEKGTERERDDP